MTEDQKAALAVFLIDVRRHYGARLLDLVLFGSFARDEANEESDIDIAVILEDGSWEFWEEKRWLAQRSASVRLQFDLFIQALPVRRSAWENPETHTNPLLIRNIKRDARPIKDAA